MTDLQSYSARSGMPYGAPVKASTGADADARRLVRAARQIAGWVWFTGVPTGVPASAAQQHGGPWPSSTQPMTTSVGDAALNRFLRPVALQDASAWLLERKGQPC